MKILILFLLAVTLFSCNKNPDDSARSLLYKYNWYEYKNDITVLNRARDTVIMFNEQSMDTCTRSAFYTFKTTGVVTRHLSCLFMGKTDADGTWSLSSDSLITVSIPLQGFNFGFHSQYSPSILISIDEFGMKTKFYDDTRMYVNGDGRDVTVETITFYAHK